MRKQYHFRPSARGVLIWDVDRLVTLSADFPPVRIPLADIRELDEPFWFGRDGDVPTCRAIVDHARLIVATDPSYPIILSADGRVMDGMHRVGAALLAGRPDIVAVRFPVDPAPDFIDVDPAALSYDETSGPGLATP